MIVAQASGPFFRWDWVFRNLGEIWSRVIEHLVLTGIAVGIGLIISLGLSLVALRWRKTYAPITWVTGILYTIPSLALFAMLVPITGLSTTTAEVGLVSYTLLILIRNIVAGIDGVSPDIKEAALGMGFTRRRLFLQIELPLALPVIVAGIRIATVTVIGLVTVTSIIGQGGLGFFILRGLNSFFWTQIIVGVVLSVVLAIVIDVALSRGERALTPWAQTRRVV